MRVWFHCAMSALLSQVKAGENSVELAEVGSRIDCFVVGRTGLEPVTH